MAISLFNSPRKNAISESFLKSLHVVISAIANIFKGWEENKSPYKAVCSIFCKGYTFLLARGGEGGLQFLRSTNTLVFM